MESQKKFQVEFNPKENVSHSKMLHEQKKMKEQENPNTLLIEARKKAEIQKQKILESAKKEAAQIIQKARKEIEDTKREVLQNAEIEGDKLREESRRQGYKEGMDRGERETEGIIQEANDTLKEAKKEKETMLQEIEPHVLDLIIQICEKVLNTSLIFKPESILYLIKKGLYEVDEEEEITIMVSDADYETVLNHKEELGKLDLEQVKIQKSNALKMGDCIIETNYGNIECSLNRQLGQIKQELAIIYNQTID